MVRPRSGEAPGVYNSLSSEPVRWLRERLKKIPFFFHFVSINRVTTVAHVKQTHTKTICEWRKKFTTVLISRVISNTRLLRMSVEHSSNCIQNHFSAPERVVLHVQRHSSDVGLGRIADFFFSLLFCVPWRKKIIGNYNHTNFSSCFRFHVSTGRCSYRAVFHREGRYWRR